MGLDQYGMIRNGHIDWKKVYSDKYEPTKDGFVWRKHARLQKFMAKEYAKQNPNEDTNEHSGNLDGLGFNGEDHKVIINKDILSKTFILRKILAPMGTTEAMEFLLDKLKDTKTNNEFFQSMGTKS